jgi:hypothetical protein
MWLGKARKRRAFFKLVRGLIDQHIKGECDICSRTVEKNNVKLVAYLSTNGEPDIKALDILIAGFENQFGDSELDPNLWKAYFRAHAEYVTRCNICQEGADLGQGAAPQGPEVNRVTRPEDISSGVYVNTFVLIPSYICTYICTSMYLSDSSDACLCIFIYD